MEDKHTPGPWHRNIKADGRYPVIFAGRNQHVAIAERQDNPAETEANISLIAAAPEMKRAGQSLADALMGLIESGRIEWTEEDAPVLHGLIEEWEGVTAAIDAATK